MTCRPFIACPCCSRTRSSSSSSPSGSSYRYQSPANPAAFWWAGGTSLTGTVPHSILEFPWIFLLSHFSHHVLPTWQQGAHAGLIRSYFRFYIYKAIKNVLFLSILDQRSFKGLILNGTELFQILYKFSFKEICQLSRISELYINSMSWFNPFKSVLRS